MGDLAASLLALEPLPLAAAAGSLVALLLAVVVALALVRRAAGKSQAPSSSSSSSGSTKGAALADEVDALKPGAANDLLEVVVEEHVADAANDAPLDVHALVATRPIGSGGQGGVWLAHDPSSGKHCALKQLRKGRLAALKKVSSVKPEACQWLVEREALLKCGGHPFVTTCYATFQDDQSLFFALELASGGDLFSLLHTSEAGQLPSQQCRFYTACVGLAIKHIHRLGFLYNDIKLENVLIGSDGYVKLCDFGLAKKPTALRQRRGGFLCNNALVNLFQPAEPRSYSKCGTDQYAPPEVVSGAGRGKGADWWALGVLLHEMLTGHSPFEGKGMAEIFARVEEYAHGGAEAAAQLRAEVTEDAIDLSEAGSDFLLGLLTPTEELRLGDGCGGFAASVQAHAWFGGLDWVALLRQQIPAPYVPPTSVTATDRKGSVDPTADEVRSEIAALFNSKSGVLRERPFEPSEWRHLFAPFGQTVARKIKNPHEAGAGGASAGSGSASAVEAPSSASKGKTSRSGGAASASEGGASSSVAGEEEAEEAMSEAAASCAGEEPPPCADDDDARTAAVGSKHASKTGTSSAGPTPLRNTAHLEP